MLNINNSFLPRFSAQVSLPDETIHFLKSTETVVKIQYVKCYKRVTGRREEEEKP